MTLSPAAAVTWGKSWPMRGPIEGWNPLWRHLQDSASIAGRLWDRWLPPVITRQIAAATGGEAAARTLVTFLAGIHDIGKATPAFAVQVDDLRDVMSLAGLPMPDRVALAERATRPHALAGHVILRRWLMAGFGWTASRADRLACVVGGHHGIPPSEQQVGAARRASDLNRQLLGDRSWEAVQDELLEHMSRRTGADQYLRDGWDHVPQTVQALLTGIVIVADWLASNTDLFPIVPVDDRRPLSQPETDDDARLDVAWAMVRLPAPWTATDLAHGADALLHARFDLPADAVARPIQQAVLHAARLMDAPGILFVEAPMGEGKTEAAMLAAEVLAARTGAGGVLVALPTQATSDAMFARVLRWLAHVPVADGAALAGAAPSLLSGDAATSTGHPVFLAHGKAWLNPAFAALPRKRIAHDVGRDDAVDRAARQSFTDRGPYVDGWMTGRKKGILADFAVGTIDQVLFGALQARHVALRQLGLARKVIILDEVHSFDAYMNSYLERTLEWLGAYGVPVVALSATLPPALRGRLSAAYLRGAAVHAHAGQGPAEAARPVSRLGPGWAAVDRAAPAAALTSNTAPAESSVVSYTIRGEERSDTVDGGGRTLDILIEQHEDDLESLAALLADAVRDEGCVLVVRNTVARAQETATFLSQRFADDVVLLHSRFLALDRKYREAALVAELGPPGPDGERGLRPRRRIVVGTQVLEQSLDVDFDLLVTDLAPTDLMLQRIGRLHRHKRPADHRPQCLDVPRCVIVGVSDWSAQPPTIVRASETVYGRHLLLRAAAQVRDVVDRGGAIRLPHDIAPLVHEAYGDAPLGPSEWQGVMDEARSKSDATRASAESKARTFMLRSPRSTGADSTLVGWLDGTVGEAEDSRGRAQVRDSQDGIEVLIVQTDSADQWHLPDWLADRAVAGENLPKGEIPRVAALRALAGCSVSLPTYLTLGRAGDELLDALEALVVEAWQRSPDLQGQLVLPLDRDRRAVIAGMSIHYDPDTGLKVSR